jgi:N-acetylmuramoyl-L-alanine amidase
MLSAISKAVIIFSSVFSFQSIAHAETIPAPTVALVVPQEVPDHVEPPIVLPVVTKPTSPTIKQSVPVSDSQLRCLVTAMNHEAGGESAKGQKAVGYVIINRSKSGRFPGTVCGVVYQKSQFANISHAKAIPTNKYNQLKTLAQEILSSYSRFNDPTHGSLYFHATSILPNWHNLVRTVIIGRAAFYK